MNEDVDDEQADIDIKSSSERYIKVDIYCPVSPRPNLPKSLHPASDPSLPPYIIHVNLSCCGQNESIFRLLREHTPLPTATYIEQLCEFGAIYLRLGPPHPRVSPRPTRVTTQSPYNLHSVLPHDELVYIRVYATPKRHKALSALRILHVTESAVVICKPAGLPVAPSVDNCKECVLTVVSNELRQSDHESGSESESGSDRTLYITTRLDIGTSGVLVLGRRRNAVRQLNMALMDARKTYVAWTASEDPPRVGRLKHWMNAALPRHRGALQGGLIAKWCEAPPESKSKEKWVVASLVIAKVEKVKRHWKAWVELETGRTHQIRVQFAAEGWTLVADDKYKAGRNVLHPVPEGTLLGEDVARVGLHALSLEVDIEGCGKKRLYESGAESEMDE